MLVLLHVHIRRVNLYLQEDWIELESKKFGPFWLNKTTGEVILHHQQRGETATTVRSSDPVTPAAEREVESGRGSAREKPQLKSRKKKVRVQKFNTCMSISPICMLL